MENKVDQDLLFDKVDEEKRDFLKKIVLGSAFALPLIQSFSMDGLKVRAAFGKNPPPASPI